MVPAERPLIFLFSEADEAGLNLLVSDYTDFLPRALANLSARDAAQDPTPEKQQERESLYLERLEYTLQQGREHRDVRLAVSAASIAQLQEKLQCWLSHTGHQDGIYDSREAPPMREKALSSLSDGVRQALLKWLAGMSWSGPNCGRTKGGETDCASFICLSTHCGSCSAGMRDSTIATSLTVIMQDRQTRNSVLSWSKGAIVPFFFIQIGVCNE